MDFPWQRKNEAVGKKSSDSKDFWETAKSVHEQMFVDFAERADEDFDSWEEFLEALRKASWKMQEALAKQSYRNGVARGRRQRADK